MRVGARQSGEVTLCVINSRNSPGHMRIFNTV